MTGQALLVCVVAAMLGTPPVNAADAEDFLRHRWYQVELIVFEQSPVVARREDFSSDGTAAREQLLEVLRYPRSAFPLAEDPGDTSRGYAFGPPPVADASLPLVVPNLPPPVWFAGPCVTEFWMPPVHWWVHPFETPRAMPPDACLPLDPWQVELAGMEQAMQQSVPTEAALVVDADDVDDTRDSRPTSYEELTQAFAQYENQLLLSSYVWRRETPGFAAERARLAGRYEILAAGSWCQPVPPRDQPQSLLVQVGDMDETRRFLLEGWLSVTLGRYIHFHGILEYRLPDGGIALFSEQRRMRSDEPHYLDHPAIGVLARVEALPVPEELDDLLGDVQELDE